MLGEGTAVFEVCHLSSKFGKTCMIPFRDHRTFTTTWGHCKPFWLWSPVWYTPAMARSLMWVSPKLSCVQHATVLYEWMKVSCNCLLRPSQDPIDKIEYYISHRNQRERQILECLTANASEGDGMTALDIVKIVYKVGLDSIIIMGQGWAVILFSLDLTGHANQLASGCCLQRLASPQKDGKRRTNWS